MIRVAAVGDIHLGTESRGKLRPALSDMHERADVFLLAGDLTHVGSQEEAEVVAEELSVVDVPIVAVLGNHDLHSDSSEVVIRLLEESGVTVLEGTGTVVDTPSGRLGIAGAKGFGGGFPPAMASCFGEPEMKAFARTAEEAGQALHDALKSLDSEPRIALTHYSPSRDTLAGEPPEIYAFLGGVALAEAVDEAGAALAIHGHAHIGSKVGRTPGGIPVRNVALPLLDTAYEVFGIEDGRVTVG